MEPLRPSTSLTKHVTQSRTPAEGRVYADYHSNLSRFVAISAKVEALGDRTRSVLDNVLYFNVALKVRPLLTSASIKHDKSNTSSMSSLMPLADLSRIGCPKESIRVGGGGVSPRTSPLTEDAKDLQHHTLTNPSVLDN